MTRRDQRLLAALSIATLGLLICPPVFADWISPGMGSAYTMDSLVSASAGAVTLEGGQYLIHESLVITVGDSLAITPGQQLVFVDDTGSVGLEINGTLEAIGTVSQRILMTGSVAEPGSWRGLDYGDVNAGSGFHLAQVEIAYADIAVDVFGADVFLEFCVIHHCLEKAIDISQGDGLIQHCRLHDNEKRTVNLTLTASPTFEDCVLEFNNRQNSSPYPFFSIGLQGVNSPTIRNCVITGDGSEMSGGIAVWNSSNALIEGNSISGCGYGILCYSVGANPTIADNIIFDNTIHPDQVNWGFGVACNGENTPILTGNDIYGHWYGVAAINGGQPNLGDVINDFPGDDGLNILGDNGLGGETYGFYNNTPLPQMAQNNYWGPLGAEACIFHQVDDPSLGLVTYDPIADNSPVGDVPGPRILEEVNAHPNPFNPRVEIRLSLSRNSQVAAVVYDIAGKMVHEIQGGLLVAGNHVLSWDGTDREGQPCPSGVYFYRVIAGHESQTGKLALVR